MYKILKSFDNSICIQKDSGDGHRLVIPTTDPANTDYQEYLKWLEAGNTPLPADEPTQGA